MKFILIGLLFSFPLMATTYKIAGNLVVFNNVDGLELAGCKGSCEALTVIRIHKSINLKKARQGMKTYNSVGSDVCDKVYKAQSLLGVAENQDGRAFCLFKDKSMVEMNSLSFYLINKKIVLDPP